MNDMPDAELRSAEKASVDRKLGNHVVSMDPSTKKCNKRYADDGSIAWHEDITRDLDVAIGFTLSTKWPSIIWVLSWARTFGFDASAVELTLPPRELEVEDTIEYYRRAMFQGIDFLVAQTALENATTQQTLIAGEVVKNEQISLGLRDTPVSVGRAIELAPSPLELPYAGAESPETDDRNEAARHLAVSVYSAVSKKLVDPEPIDWSQFSWQSRRVPDSLPEQLDIASKSGQGQVEMVDDNEPTSTRRKEFPANNASPPKTVEHQLGLKDQFADAIRSLVAASEPELETIDANLLDEGEKAISFTRTRKSRALLRLGERQTMTLNRVNGFLRSEWEREQGRREALAEEHMNDARRQEIARLVQHFRKESGTKLFWVEGGVERECSFTTKFNNHIGRRQFRVSTVGGQQLAERTRLPLLVFKKS